MSARLTDLTLVECKLPQLPIIPGYYNKERKGVPAAGIRVAVSNNGDLASKSNPLDMISYDSACLTCSASNRICVHKVKLSCVGKVYAQIIYLKHLDSLFIITSITLSVQVKIYLHGIIKLASYKSLQENIYILDYKYMFR